MLALTNKKILITGGAGYIGSHVARQLDKMGAKITILDNLSTGTRKSIRVGEFIEGDIGNHNLLENLFSSHNFDGVMHFAGSIVVPESVTNPLLYYQNNTSHSSQLIQMCVNHQISAFIFSSTAAVYGMPKDGTCHEENLLNPINPYGRSKLMTEWVLEDTAQAHNFKYVALRYFNVAGAAHEHMLGQYNPKSTHLIKIACQTAYNKRESIQVYGNDYPTPDGTCIRDYIHIEDLANAHLLALNYLFEGGKSNIFNCGYSQGFSVKEVLETVQKVHQKPIKIIQAKRRPGDPPKLIGDSSKIKNQLKWTPQFNDIETIVRSAYLFEAQLND